MLIDLLVLDHKKKNRQHLLSQVILIRGWKQQGWNPLRKNLFLAVQDTDASLDNFLKTGNWRNYRRTAEQWTDWAHNGARSKAVTLHPDLGSVDTSGPLTYEVEVYQGCVRYKRGCKFCIEPKKGIPIWRSPEDIIREELERGA